MAGGASVRVIGVGNPDRGDDAAGRAVARWLAEHLSAGLPGEIEVLEHDGEATGLLACLEGAEAVYFIDACVAAGPPGAVRRFDVAAAPLPSGAFGCSTHGMGLAEAVELARTFGALPPRCVVYAIEGESFVPGAPLSPAVSQAVAEAGGQLRAEIAG